MSNAIPKYILARKYQKSEHIKHSKHLLFLNIHLKYVKYISLILFKNISYNLICLIILNYLACLA